MVKTLSKSDKNNEVMLIWNFDILQWNLKYPFPIKQLSVLSIIGLCPKDLGKQYTVS